MASNALNSLEYWLKTIDLTRFQIYFSKILNKFDSYLQKNQQQNATAKHPNTILFLNVKSSSRGGRQKLPIKLFEKNLGLIKSTIKQADDSANDLLNEQIQFRILKIIGQLAGQMSHSLYENINTDHIIAWDTTKYLKFTIPFVDMKPDIYLDHFLPRIIELALTSTNRQIKINACELLHSIIVFSIGKNATLPSNQSKTTVSRLNSKIYRCIFRLAVDVDQFTRNLYQPLCMQIIHWYTGNRQYENRETVLLLECILECLTDNKDALLRDFSASSLREFLKWSIKHTPVFTDDQGQQQTKTATTNPLNIKSVLKRIYNLLMHPNCAKRLGGALAWNSIYTLFREEIVLVDIYIFEILYYFVECLAISQNDDPLYGTQEHCKIALDHIERIIHVKHDVLNRVNRQRHKPHGWSEACLEVCVRWLMRQCGRIEIECRHKSMQLVYKLAGLIDGFKTTKDYFDLKFKSDGVVYFLSRFEGSTDSTLDRVTMNKYSLGKYPVLADLIDDHSSFYVFKNIINWLNIFIAPLDCYTWIFSQQLLVPAQLFSTSTGKTVIWTSIAYFIQHVALVGLVDLAKNLHSKNPLSNALIFSSNEIDEYKQIKCTAIVRLIEFLTIMLHGSNAQFMPDSIITDKLFYLLLDLCLNRSQLGFNLNDLAVFTNLNQILTNFFRNFVLVPKLKVKLQTFSSSAFENSAKSSYISIVDYLSLTRTSANTDENCIQAVNWFKLMQIVNGFELLNEFDIYKMDHSVNKVLLDYIYDSSDVSQAGENVFFVSV
jgi:DNA-dependent protein kinase catalytic subunit